MSSRPGEATLKGGCSGGARGPRPESESICCQSVNTRQRDRQENITAPAGDSSEAWRLQVDVAKQMAKVAFRMDVTDVPAAVEDGRTLRPRILQISVSRRASLDADPPRQQPSIIFAPHDVRGAINVGGPRQIYVLARMIETIDSLAGSYVVLKKPVCFVAMTTANVSFCATSKQNCQNDGCCKTFCNKPK